MDSRAAILFLATAVLSMATPGAMEQLHKITTEIDTPCADVEETLIQLSELELNMTSVNTSTANAEFEVNREIEKMDLTVSLWNCEENDGDDSFDCYNQGTWNVTNACENLQPPWNVFSSCPIQPGTYQIINAPFLMEVTKRRTEINNYWKANVEVYEEGKKVACVGGLWAFEKFVKILDYEYGDQ